VNLYSIVNDTEKKIELIVDKRIIDEFEFVGFHPMVNTATTAIRTKDVAKIIELSGHKLIILDFATIATEAAAEKPK
jgi:Ala-tRNA(Pro) deacylase